MSDNDNDIDELLRYLDNDYWPGKHRALTALVAERNALRQRVAELEKSAFYIPPKHPPADRDRELRERLICAALTGLMAYSGQSSHRTCEDWADASVRQADAALAAMRKGEQDGK